MCPLFGVQRWPLFGGSKCIGIMGRSNGGSVTVRSIERPSSEVLLYMKSNHGSYEKHGTTPNSGSCAHQ